jgi:hypothetical protein
MSNQQRTIPAGWTDADKRRFLKIAKGRKEEHLSAYALIAIGAQLYFLDRTRQELRHNKPTGPSKLPELAEEDESTVQINANGQPQDDCADK